MISEEKLQKLKKEFSDVYIEFYLKELEKKERRNWYEKLCYISSKIIPLKIENKKLSEDIVFSNLNVLPGEVISLALFSFIFLFIIFIPFYFIFSDIGIFLFVVPIGISFILYNYPSFKAQVNKIQTNSEAIKIITYLVLYLEQNPNFEAALEFTSRKNKGILADDLRKIIWDLKTGRFSNLKEAIEFYVPKWMKWNENFVRTLILLSNIGYVTSQEERRNLLRKTLDFILSKNLEETKIYVEKVRNPITLLFMFGLLMPSIGLIMFPMISVFLHLSVKPGYIIFGYLVVLPLLNLYLITRTISLRPGAFLIVDISKHPKLAPTNYFYLGKILIPIIPLVIIVFLIISLYGFLHFIDFYSEYYRLLNIGAERRLEELVREENSIENIENLIDSFLIPLALGASLFLYFYLNSFQKVKIRKEIKDIEDDLPNLLVTSGNFLESGYPVEKTIEKTLEEYERLGLKEKPGYKFFKLLRERIMKFGENVNLAIFGKNGLINYFPSVLLEEVFRILIDTTYKSVKSAGNIAKTIARYLENLFQAEFRLKELLSDVRGNLKMQAQFLIPIITGIVSSTGIFIINMLAILSNWLGDLEKVFGAVGTFKEIIDVMVGDFKKVIPLTVLQAVVGCYTVIAIVLMSYLLSGIESGFDRVARDYEIAENLKFGLIIYFIVGVMSLIVFSQIAQQLKLGLT
ncbi:MAG: hypothetical protein QXO40_02525 [Candidatus Aenigmatarchaeota archaeon]